MAALLRPLTPELQSRIRSGVAITSVAQCVEELVLNSLDAGATCVAVRLDLPCSRIQVVDNGYGLGQDQLKAVAERYSTSKCHSIEDLDEKLQHFGYRGEALASIRDISAVLEIESRSKFSTQTFKRHFKKGRPLPLKESEMHRPSAGTTVTVQDLFYGLPVRQKCLNETLELERVRQRMEAIALIHPMISFSFRDEATCSKVLQTHKSNSVLGSFKYLFGAAKARPLRRLSKSDGKYTIQGYISKENHHNKNLQFIYINDRIVLKTKLHKSINYVLSKSTIVKRKVNTIVNDGTPKIGSQNASGSPQKQGDRYGVFVINIYCPLSEYDVTFDPAKTLVEFKNWEDLQNLLEGLVMDFLISENLVLKMEDPTPNTSAVTPMVGTAVTSCVNDVCDQNCESQKVDRSMEGLQNYLDPQSYGTRITTENTCNTLCSETVRRTQTQNVNAIVEDIIKKKTSEEQMTDKELHTQDVDVTPGPGGVLTKAAGYDQNRGHGHGKTHCTTKISSSTVSISMVDSHSPAEVLYKATQENENRSEDFLDLANGNANNINSRQGLSDDIGQQQILHFSQPQHQAKSTAYAPTAYLPSVKQTFSNITASGQTPINVCSKKTEKNSSDYRISLGNTFFDSCSSAGMSSKTSNKLLEEGQTSKVTNIMKGNTGPACRSGQRINIPGITPMLKIKERLHNKYQTGNAYREENTYGSLKHHNTISLEKFQDTLLEADDSMSCQSNSWQTDYLSAFTRIRQSLKSVKDETSTNQPQHRIQLVPVQQEQLPSNSSPNTASEHGEQVDYCDPGTPAGLQCDFSHSDEEPLIPFKESMKVDPYSCTYLKPSEISPQNTVQIPGPSKGPCLPTPLTLLGIPRKRSSSGEDTTRLPLAAKLSRLSRGLKTTKVNCAEPDNCINCSSFQHHHNVVGKVPMADQLCDNSGTGNRLDVTQGGDHVSMSTEEEEEEEEEEEVYCSSNSGTQPSQNTDVSNTSNSSAWPKQSDVSICVDSLLSPDVIDQKTANTAHNFDMSNEGTRSVESVGVIVTHTMWPPREEDTMGRPEAQDESVAIIRSVSVHPSLCLGSDQLDFSPENQEKEYPAFLATEHEQFSHCDRKSFDMPFGSSSDNGEKDWSVPMKERDHQCQQTVMADKLHSPVGGETEQASDHYAWRYHQNDGVVFEEPREISVKDCSESKSPTHEENLERVEKEPLGIHQDITSRNQLSYPKEQKGYPNFSSVGDMRHKTILLTDKGDLLYQELNLNCYGSEPGSGTMSHKVNEDTEEPEMSEIQKPSDVRKLGSYETSPTDRTCSTGDTRPLQYPWQASDTEPIPKENMLDALEYPVEFNPSSTTDDRLSSLKAGNETENSTEYSEESENHVPQCQQSETNLHSPSSPMNIQTEEESTTEESPKQCQSTYPPMSGGMVNTSSGSTSSPEKVIFVGQSWACKVDPNTGRKVFINRITGNSSYQPPGESEVHNLSDAASHGPASTRAAIHMKNPLLPRGMTPPISTDNQALLPRPRGKRNQTGPSASNDTVQASDSTGTLSAMFADHIGGQSTQTEEEVTVKWRQGVLPKDVANQTEISQLFQDWENPTFRNPNQSAQNVDASNALHGATKIQRAILPHRFTSDMLKAVKVFGQVDNKFIACLLRKTNNESVVSNSMLVVVDQHAAHERVRLERLTKEAYEEDGVSVRRSQVSPAMEIRLTEEEVRIVKAYRTGLEKIGVEFTVDITRRDMVYVHAVPTCLFEREVSEVRRGRAPVTVEVIESLIKEHIELLQNTHGAAGTLPNSICRILNSQACHGAIKFGDPLTMGECEKLIDELADCRLPFQCAHGRPSVMPVLDLDHLHVQYPTQTFRPKIWKLRRMMDADRQDDEQQIDKTTDG